MTDAREQQLKTAPPLLPRWQLFTLLIGFPLLYWINGLLPWSYRLFIERDHSYFIMFGASVCVLHWASLLTALWFLRQAGARPSDIGLDLRASTLVSIIVVVALVGGVLTALPLRYPISEEPPSDWRFYYPFTLTERVFLIFMAFSAGFCEEVVYRGFAISALRWRGFQTWQAVALATLAFVLIHGVAALFMFPFLLVAGLFYAAIFLWRKSLTPGILLHALFDVMAVAAI